MYTEYRNTGNARNVAPTVFREQVLEVKADLVRDSPGLAIDIGGSVSKFLYRTKEDWDEVNNNKTAPTGHLHLLSCTRSAIDEAMAKVKPLLHLTPSLDGTPTKVFTTGIGCHQLAPRISKTLSVKTTNLVESDCFLHGFKYLVENFNFKTGIMPTDKKLLEKLAKEKERLEADMAKFQEFSNVAVSAQEEVKEEEKPDPFLSDLSVAKTLGDDMYPCILAILGSGIGFMTVNADGTFGYGDMSIRGGKTLLGLGSLLCDCHSYDELIDLAEKGNMFNLSVSQLGFAAAEAPQPGQGAEEGDAEDPYASMLAGDMMERALFSFGHAVGKSLGDFSREDRAAALVNMMVSEMVQTSHKTCLVSGVKNMFVTGSYTSRPYIRDLFTFEWKYRIQEGIAYGNAGVECGLHFLADGGHLGALGALINNVQQFIEGGANNAEQPETQKEQ